MAYLASLGKPLPPNTNAPHHLPPSTHRYMHPGDIAKCLDVQCGEVLVSDRLRKLLLDEEDEEWELFSEAERRELIFHVLRRLAVGGGLNQCAARPRPRPRTRQRIRARTLDTCVLPWAAAGTTTRSRCTCG